MLHLRIGLLTNRQALENDLAALYDPNSPQYGQYLSPQEVAARYGVPQATIDTLTSYLQGMGFQTLSVSALRDSLTVSASAAQIEQAFQISLQTFQQNGRTFFGPSGTVTLPAALKSQVTSIDGLNNFAQLSHRLFPGIPQRQTTPAHNPSVDCSGVNAGVSTNQVAAVYNYTAAYKAGYTGKGMRIGVIEYNDAGISLSDMTTFVTCMTHSQLHYSVTQVDGGATVSDPNDLAEAEMDIEYLQALAPDAQIIEYQGANSMLDVLNQIAAEGRVQVVSESYAYDSEDGVTPDVVNAYDQTIKRLAAEGITLAEDSGDCAAYGTMQYGKLGVAFPNSDPYTLSVGGTVLATNGNGKRTSEPAWSDSSADKSQCQNSWGTGGGISTVIKQPSWQKGLGPKNNTYRLEPDVAADALNLTLYFQGQWSAYGGGTSSATPIWAAGIALVDQALLKHHKHLVGAAPTFYQVESKRGKYHPYYDITSGNNLYYKTGVGFDLVTGWGAPNLLDFGKVLGAF